MAGCDTAEITRRAGISKPSVWHWQERFTREGVAGLLRDKTRKPGLPSLLPAQIEHVVELTLSEPPGEATHWTGRAMASATGISLRSVQRIWAAHGHAKQVERLEPGASTGGAAYMAELARPTAAAGYDTGKAADPFFVKRPFALGHARSRDICSGPVESLPGFILLSARQAIDVAVKVDALYPRDETAEIGQAARVVVERLDNLGAREIIDTRPDIFVDADLERRLAFPP